MKKICPKCGGEMPRIGRFNKDCSGYEFYYFECRCGYRVKENGEEMERSK